jgi:uncharacterized lipoprotein YbaY
MRSAALIGLLAIATLAGCGGKPSAPQGGSAATPAPAAANGPAVTGTVLFDTPMALAPGALLNVRLVDITRADGDPMAVVQKSFPITGLPAEFSLAYDSHDVNSIRSYAVDASVTNAGQIAFVSMGRVGAITQGKPSRVTLRLGKAMAAAEAKDPVVELNKEFADFEARLGGLKRFANSRIVGPEGKETAIGWDAFADDGGVRMVRETVSDAEGGNRFTRRFAFKNGKPWVIVRSGTGPDLKLGWDDAGALIVHELNGATAEVADADVQALQAAAREAASVATAQYGGSK